MDDNKKKDNPEEVPYCFGRLSHVFPMGENGFRESPESCMPCIFKTRCLRQAMAGPDGLQVKVEMVDRAQGDGWRGAFKRWSTRKTLTQKIKRFQKKGEG